MLVRFDQPSSSSSRAQSCGATLELAIQPVSRAERAEECVFSLSDGLPGGQLPGPQTAGFTKAGVPLPINPSNLLPEAPGEPLKDNDSHLHCGKEFEGRDPELEKSLSRLAHAIGVGKDAVLSSSSLASATSLGRAPTTPLMSRAKHSGLAARRSSSLRFALVQ